MNNKLTPEEVVNRINKSQLWARRVVSVVLRSNSVKKLIQETVYDEFANKLKVEFVDNKISTNSIEEKCTIYFGDKVVGERTRILYTPLGTNRGSL